MQKRAKRDIIHKAISLIPIVIGVVWTAYVAFGHNLYIQEGRPSNMAELRSLARSMSDEDWSTIDERAKMDAIMKSLRKTFDNGRPRHTLETNWILFLLGQLNEYIAAPRIPNVMLRSTPVLQCGEFSYLAMRMALEEGIRARHVGLYGHVVMEAFYDDRWHMYDPSNEVYADSEGMTYPVSYLERHPETIGDIYRHRTREKIDRIIEKYGTTENNTYMTIPRGTWFNPKGEILMRFEAVAEVLKWIVPVMVLLFGMTMIVRFRHDRA